jgi:enoyl-CoA hydratase
MPENLLVETTGAIVTITMNRPKALNALNAKTLLELGEALDGAKAGGARVVILTGGGEKAFVAGADIAEMQGLDRGQAQEFGRLGHGVINKLGDPQFVSIAAINGFALGGGLELALGCDLLFCSDNARLGLPEVSLGLIPGFGGTQRLARVIGRQQAKALVFTGDPIDAAKARALGLVVDVVPRDQLLAHCRAVAERILTRGPSAVRAAKEAIDGGLDRPIAAGLEHELSFFGSLFGSAETHEGLTAFVEKRKPTWP